MKKLLKELNLRYLFAVAAIPLATPVINVVTRSAECRVACQYNSYYTGSYDDEHCICSNIRDYYELTHHRRLSLPHKYIKGTNKATYTPYKEATSTWGEDY